MRKKITIAAVVVVAAAGVTTAVAASGGSDTGPTRDSFPSSPQSLAHFSVLKSARTASDAVPAALHPESLDIAATNSRQVAAGSAGSAWLTADDKLTCLSISLGGGGTASCHPTSEVAAGFGYVSGDVSDGAVTVAGIAPDGVDAVDVHVDGADDQKVAVSSNGYIAVVKGTPTSVSYTDAGGAHSWPLVAFHG